ncbi:MAG TPA: PIG-L family deacetylase [Candidatus Binatia bacterium]|nr:PIG-L family deacetylase [Candidatus Binatia bacterium]
MRTQPLELRADDSLLVVAAHPDDETLAAGGLLQHARAAGCRVTVLIATDGENNPWPQRVLERRWRIGEEDRRRFGARRRAEARRALAVLALEESSLVFFSLPDQGLTRLAIDDPAPAVDRLRAELALRRPTIVVVSSVRDHHPDHSALGLLLEIAIAGRAQGSRPARVLHYQVHGGRELHDRVERFAVGLTPGERDTKRRAILTYRSQLVFRGRFFLSFADDRELFHGPAIPTHGDARHPICEASVDEQQIRLKIRSRSPIWSVQQKTVLLIGLDATGRPIPLTYPAGDGELIVPRSRMRGARRLFVKLEHRWSFFDADGWREIPIEDAIVAPARDATAIASDSRIAAV